MGMSGDRFAIEITDSEDEGYHEFAGPLDEIDLMEEKDLYERNGYTVTVFKLVKVK